MCCGEGGTLQTNITGVCGECSQCMDHTGFAPANSGVYFLGVHCSGSGLLCRALSKLGPAFSALSRSKPLSFSFLGTPQGDRLSWAGVLCPFQVRATQVTRCFASAQSPRALHLNHLPGPSCLSKSTVSGVLRVSYGELISGCDPPGRCQLSRIPGRHG